MGLVAKPLALSLVVLAAGVERRQPPRHGVFDLGNRVGLLRASFPRFSKDNVFFGVRAVDRDGHSSPVAFPAPR